MPEPLLAVDAAYAAGQVIGRLLFLALAVYLLVSGFRIRRDPSPKRGILRIVCGALLILGSLAAVTTPAATNSTTSAPPVVTSA